MSLDGHDDYVSIGNESDFDITDQITVAAWVKMPINIRGVLTIAGKGESAWKLHAWCHNRIRFHCVGIWPRNINEEITMEDRQWHHVAGVYDGSKLCVYVDGVLKACKDAHGRISKNNYNVSIGENLERSGCKWKGLIDDVVIFDHALDATEIAQLYTYGGISFDTNRYILKLVEESRIAIGELNPEEAIAFVKERIDEFEEWQEENANDVKLYDKLLYSKLYLLLARAQAAAGYPKKDVVAMCKRAIFPMAQGLAGSEALTWLFENLSAEEYTSVVGDLVQDNVAHKYQLVIREFEANGNWPAFKAFLDVLLDKNDNPLAFAKYIENNLGAWEEKYIEYCRSKPQLTEYVFEKGCEVAEKYIAKYNYKEAVKIYRDIVKRYGPSRQTAALELKVCECLLDGGEYQNVLSELDRFIARNKGVYKAEVIKALSMKGKAYVQLGDASRAIEQFLRIMAEYPESNQASEASFLVGYCYMVKQEFEQAIAAFNVVVRDYPESTHAGKAHTYLSRIKNMVR